MAKQTLKKSLETKINDSKRNVFKRSDFESLGDYDQIGRGLLTLTKQKKLIKLGYGLYVKARTNRLSGEAMIAASGGFTQVAKESLSRLGCKWEFGESVQSYQNGSTQIPVNPEIIISGRFNRKIGTDKFTLIIRKKNNGF